VKRTWRAKLVLAVLGTLVALLLAEGIVRLFALAPQLAAIRIDEPHASFVSSPNPTLKYVPNPGTGDINADGFRDRVYDRRKPDGTLRIVVIGDSIGFGYCNESRATEIRHTFANVLEDELNPGGLWDHDRVEVLNLSVSGYDTVQEVEFLAVKGLAYEPDVVLIAYCLNDLMLASRELFLFEKDAEWEAYRAAAEMVYRSAVFRSHLVRFVWHRAPSVAARFSSQEERPDRERGIARTAEGFRRIRELSDRFEFRTIVVIFPFFREFERYPYVPLHRSVTAEAKRHDLAVLDLFPFYAAASAEASNLCTPCCDLHPNENGHAVTARAIAESLRRMGSR
jgi:lysophospholipase L1-like esterase